MSSFGVIPTGEGFNRKLVDDALAEIVARLQAEFGVGVSTNATAIFGQLAGVQADREAELWEVAEAVYRALQVDFASGDALDQLAVLTGVLRLQATRSTGTIEAVLDNGTTLALNRVVSSSINQTTWQTTAAVTNSAGARDLVQVAIESVNFGAIEAVASSIDTIDTPVAGWVQSVGIKGTAVETFPLSDGLTLTFDVDDGNGSIENVVATFNTADFGNIALATAAEVAAVISTDASTATANAVGGQVLIVNDSTTAGNSITITGGTAAGILGFTTGLTKGFNRLDATPGRELETDAELRLRREQLLATSGKATVDAIRAAVLQVADVTEAMVFENTDLVTNADGIPGKAFEVVVRGGDDTAIAQAIFDTKAAGIESHGTTAVVVTDSQGTSHTIEFTRPTEIDIYVDLTITVDAGDYPTDGDDQVKAAIVALNNTLTIGDDIYETQVACAPLTVAGVVNVPVIIVDTQAIPPGVGQNPVPVNCREVAVFDTSRIDLTVVTL